MTHPAKLTDHDLYLFNEGTHFRLYEKFGAHPVVQDGIAGVQFAVWAPNAGRIAVIGEFNGWDKSRHAMEPRGSSGVWELFVPGAAAGQRYKYFIESRIGSYSVDKTDPFANFAEIPPQTASVIWNLDYEWNDRAWMASRRDYHSLQAPVSIYEVHLGSWIRDPSEPDRILSCREVAPRLAAYVRRMGFTHVELLPVMEHPFYASWGYQTTGYFAPSSRYGNPQDFMYLIDHLHQEGIGVILDWVPSHFPSDEHGLAYFDGTHLYEHADPRLGYHPDWRSYIFNYGRHEVRSFLASSAVFWLDKYHADGLRVDAVASMLYLDYSRKEGEWIPNRYGGKENLEAISFLRWLNETIYAQYPDVQTVAEESTAWPMVSKPVYVGGLGFGLKWDMGWMHDMLEYFSLDSVFRQFHHNQITFRMLYAFTENFVLPLSHDEVVHGKGSLLGKMPGDEWQQFANLRLLFAAQFAQPGKKLLFMGSEFGQRREWDHDQSLDWHLADTGLHAGMQRLMGDLNRLYRGEPALHELDAAPDGFQWIDCHDSQQSVVSFLRRGTKPDRLVAVVFNLTPVPRHGYRIGLPMGGRWAELLNTDSRYYGGSGQGNLGGIDTEQIPAHGHQWSARLTLPPLGAIFLKQADGQ
ncbi:MAG: 1,4-alpha-glucan branching protein GlgB [Deltaproteobacteria bacterium]|nr:1,4-alpha-glucan branching protein GlgB [Deltaproteobacteria bacterium]